MHLIGWSTGAILPKGDKANYPLAVELLSDTLFTCIEFGVLRESELPIFLECLPDLDISKFDRVSFHACKPNKLIEKELLKKIEPVIEKGWPIIVHPDMITDYSLWKELGDQLYVENMDNSRFYGKTVEDMVHIFNELPDASMCLDVGHTRQIDPTMQLCKDLCIKFGNKIKEMHFSEVDVVTCGHKAITSSTLKAFEGISNYLPPCPIILEYAPMNVLDHTPIENIKTEIEYISWKWPKYGIPVYLRKGE